MANKPTQEEIDTQIARLREIKPRVRRTIMFGGDTWAALEAQIRVLQQKLDEDDVYNEWADDEYIRDSALHAAQWLVGEGDRAYPFEDEWNSLVKPQ